MGLTAFRRWRYGGEEEAQALSSTTTPLPENFPGRALLLGAGYGTLEAVRSASDEELLAIKGLGRKLLEQIRDALRQQG